MVVKCFTSSVPKTTLQSFCPPQGYLMDVEKEPVWNIENLVAELSIVDNLRGKPKILIVQACRGRKYTQASTSQVLRKPQKPFWPLCAVL